MKVKPIIGVLGITLENLPEYYEDDLNLDDEVAGLDGTVVLFTPAGIDWDRGQVRGLVLGKNGWEEDRISFPHAIYNRLYGTHSGLVIRLADKLGHHRVFNHNNRLDKTMVHNILAKSTLKPYLPATSKFNIQLLFSWLSKYQQLIVKPQKGHYGKEVYKIVKTKTDYEVYYETDHQPVGVFSRRTLEVWLIQTLGVAANQKYLLQQWIESVQISGRYFDTRALVHKISRGQWQVPGQTSRLARRGYFVSNFVEIVESAERIATKLGSEELPNQLTKIAIEAAQLLDRYIGELAEISIDYLIDEQLHPWILEVNGKPTKDLFTYLADDQLISAVYLQPLKYGISLVTIN